MRLSYNNDEFVMHAAGGRDSILLALELFCVHVETACGLWTDYDYGGVE